MERWRTSSRIRGGGGGAGDSDSTAHLRLQRQGSVIHDVLLRGVNEELLERGRRVVSLEILRHRATGVEKIHLPVPVKRDEPPFYITVCENKTFLASNRTVSRVFRSKIHARSAYSPPTGLREPLPNPYTLQPLVFGCARHTFRLS